MHYRTTTPDENGFDNETVEYENTRAYVQSMMESGTPAELLDSILVIVNVCEMRAVLQPGMADWYSTTAAFFRAALDTLASSPDDVCPQERLENPMLYFPEAEHMH